MKAARSGLVADRSLRGDEFSQAYTALADGWLESLFTASAGDRPGVSLVAVGGYGRGDLCPGSDLDLLLVHARWGQAEIKGLAESIWYPLWDAGLKVGHATRTVKEALALAAADLDTATSMLDTRRIAGDGPLAHDLAARARNQWRAGADRWLPALADAVEARNARLGEVAFLLEPDIKEARGGLRDVHSLRWAEAARRTLFQGDDETIETARRVLVDVRVALHRLTGKAGDVLLLQDQDAVADELGYSDADSLMAAVASAGRTVAWRSDEAWSLVRRPARRGRGRVAPPGPVGDGLVWREGVVELAPGANVSGDPGLPLRAAAAAAGAGSRVGRDALMQMAAQAWEPPDPWPASMRDDLVNLLWAGRDAIPVIEALDQVGLLVKLIPEWQAVRSRPQRNAYHRFTVDRHLIEAAVGAAEFTDRVHRPDLLLVGALLHDIGKGYVPELSHDHSEAGVTLVGRIATRMGFAPDDVAVLEALVRHHLLLADVATRRDVNDPATSALVASALGRRETLHLLHALTEADSLATGPAAWSAWKSGLVTELVLRSEQALAGQEIPEGSGAARFPGPDHQAALAAARQRGEVVVEGKGHWVTVAAPDHPGLFSRVAGTLSLHGLDVLTARAWSGDDGVAVEEFRVEPVFGGDPGWDSFAADLVKVSSGRLSLEARVAERSHRYSGGNRVTSATEARSSVAFDNDASATATVVEVHAPDRIGTLYRITRALAELHLDIRHAKVTTLGHQVVDAFYVVDSDGNKLDLDHAAEVERAVMLELSRL